MNLNIGAGTVVGVAVVVVAVIAARKLFNVAGETAEAINDGATNALQAVGIVPEGRTIGGTAYEGVQWLTSLFTGKPTDNELVRQQPPNYIFRGGEPPN